MRCARTRCHATPVVDRSNRFSDRCDVRVSSSIVFARLLTSRSHESFHLLDRRVPYVRSGVKTVVARRQPQTTNST